MNPDEEVKPQVDVNLDTARDERVLPVTKEVINEMVDSLVPKEVGPTMYNDLVQKTLSLMLDRDLNVALDTSYLPQLILGALAGLNKTVQSCTVISTDEQDERFRRVSRELLKIVAEADLNLLANADEMIVQFEPLKEKFNALFAEEKLTELELKYVIDTIFNSFNAFNSLLSSSIERAVRKMECKLLGVQNMEDLTLKKLDEVLIS